MKPWGFALGLAALLATAAAASGDAAGHFDKRLSKDKQAVHVLNRLAYGPRPGDVDAVRRLGVERWIRQQLDPDRIPEDSALADKLRPIGSLQLATWELFEKYQPPPALLPALSRPVSPAQLLPPDQARKLTTGAVEERRAVLMAVTPEVRRQLLAVIPAQTLEGLPELQAEAAKARIAQQQQVLTLRRRVPLTELLSAADLAKVQRGTNDEKTEVLKALDAEKRRQVLQMLPAQSVPEAYRREAMAAREPQQFVTAELVEGKVYRAVYSNRQLQEVLVDFWLNHFNVFNGKGSVRMLLTSYERDAIRPHIFGRFRDMLLATARHPAMLFYLDNWLSQEPRDEQPPTAGRRPGLNENYGRELLELHTLGVDGGYTQADVIAVARAFTGWTIYDPNRIGEFQFNPAMHDRKPKVILGQTLPAGGNEQEAVTVIDMLARHPSTARFIARKLAQRFVADDPPEPLVKRMAETFSRTDGDLRAVVETLVTSKEFMSEGAYQSKLKSPLEMVISALRALNADVTDGMALGQRIAELGQPLYGKAEPTGYPNTGEGWASSASLLGRINFATALTAGRIQGAKVDATRLPGSPASAFEAILGLPPPAATLTTIGARLQGQPADPALVATVVIASPDFQKR